MFMGPSWEVPWLLGNPGILGQGGRLVCSVFMGPSWELPWVLGNPGILGQGGRLACSVFMGPSRELPGVLGNPGILGQGGRLVCSVFMGPSREININNSQQVLHNLHKINDTSKAYHFDSFDFSTLYTSISHSSLKGNQLRRHIHVQ